MQRASTRTLAPFAPKIYTRRGDQDVVDHCEAAFAAHPLPVFGNDARIVKDGGLVEKNASAVDRPRKRHLVGVEELESRLPADLIGLVAQDVEDRVGGEENVGIRGEVWRILVSQRPGTPTDSTYCGWS